jgi:chemotaxis protein CheD
MFHRRLGIGAICHGLLPQCREKTECTGDCLEGMKYVDCSIHRMAKHFRRLGAAPHEIEVKVFGGADMFGARPGGMGGISVGKQNAEKALEIVKKEGLRVTAQDLGGTQGRKIYFNTETGEVLLKRLQPNVVLAGDEVGQ